MSMLHGGGPYNDSPKLGMGAEKCTPDYESMVKRIKEKLNRSTAFRDAALEYYKGRRAEESMAQLIGELVTECNQLQLERDSLIAAQEADSE